MSASTASSCSIGIAANASLLGANTVNGPSPLNVSTSPAVWTADARVVKYGLFDAAIATGSSAIPSNDPSPSGGIDAQNGPCGPGGASVVGGAVPGCRAPPP